MIRLIYTYLYLTCFIMPVDLILDGEVERKGRGDVCQTGRGDVYKTGREDICKCVSSLNASIGGA